MHLVMTSAFPESYQGFLTSLYSVDYEHKQKFLLPLKHLEEQGGQC